MLGNKNIAIVSEENDVFSTSKKVITTILNAKIRRSNLIWILSRRYRPLINFASFFNC